ncbi:MAG: long-chain fatty acid--CoA ligase, partial [Bradymonadaceae bacterium]
MDGITDRDLVVDRFLDNVGERGAKPALWHKDDDEWTAIEWSDYGQMAREFAGALIASGYEAGDCVSISGYTCPKWVISDLGAMMARAVPVGVYYTNSPAELGYIARHSESRIVVARNREHWKKVDEVRDELPDLERVVVMEGGDEIDDPLVVSWDEFLAEGREHLDEVEKRFREIEPDDIGTMIYTSGTTGDPKGVMLSHDNLAFTADVARQILGGLEEGDCMVSYLPLSHIAEQMFTIHLAVTFGYPIWFADDVYNVLDALKAARPTFFFGVPRIWEKFKSKLESRLEEATGWKAKMVDWCRDVGREAGYERIQKGEVRGLLGWKYALADKLFFSKLKGELGLDRLRMAISAAAPIGKDVLEFFLSCDITIREVYGQSEDCGPTTVNMPEPGKTKLGTVGVPIPGVEVEIADEDIYDGDPEGEILVKGRNVFQGYYKNQEATDETLVDGWLHSGDIGRFDDDGFLEITGRKKQIIITAGGKNVAPPKIEGPLKEIDGVGHAVVIGDGRKFLSALIALDEDRIDSLAEQHGVEPEPESLV